MSNKIKCSHILVEKQSESLAILEKIKKGEKFGNLAKEFSTDKGSGKKEVSTVGESIFTPQDNAYCSIKCIYQIVFYLLRYVGS